MTGHTEVLSVHFLRRVARAREREIQGALDAVFAGTGGYALSRSGDHPVLARFEVPPWTSGVRIEKAGLLQWAVVATEGPGH
jgi:hypothetical protein